MCVLRLTKSYANISYQTSKVPNNLCIDGHEYNKELLVRLFIPIILIRQPLTVPSIPLALPQPRLVILSRPGRFNRSQARFKRLRLRKEAMYILDSLKNPNNQSNVKKPKRTHSSQGRHSRSSGLPSHLVYRHSARFPCVCASLAR